MAAPMLTSACVISDGAGVISVGVKCKVESNVSFTRLNEAIATSLAKDGAVKIAADNQVSDVVIRSISFRHCTKKIE